MSPQERREQLALNVLHKTKSFSPDHRLRSQLAAQRSRLDAKLTPFWDWVHERWSTNCDPGCNAAMGDAEANFKGHLKRHQTERRQAAWEGGGGVWGGVFCGMPAYQHKTSPPGSETLRFPSEMDPI